MSSTGLPVDPENPGNVWCESCQQSIGDNRAAAHLVSKKHLGNAAPAATAATIASSGETKASKKATKKPAVIEFDDDGDDEVDAALTAKKGAKSTKPSSAPRSTSSLPADPDKPGNYWCGICQVSLTASKAEDHPETARHKDNTVKHLSSAMKATKISK